MPIKYKFTDPTKILTLANFISLGRAILAVPIIYTLQDPKMGTVSFLLIIIAVLSDALDGWVARKAHEVTHFGKWIDRKFCRDGTSINKSDIKRKIITVKNESRYRYIHVHLKDTLMFWAR